MSTSNHLVTAYELKRLSDQGHRYELVKGELLTMSPSSGKHGAIAMRLSRILANYIEEEGLGLTFAAETGFKLEQDPDTVLAPDFAFVAAGRLSTIPDGFVSLAPDLVFEVVSPSQSHKETRRKAEQWILHGVKLVWLVHPKKRTIEVFSEHTSPVLLTDADELSADALIAGFRLQLKQLFLY